MRPHHHCVTDVRTRDSLTQVIQVRQQQRRLGSTDDGADDQDVAVGLRHAEALQHQLHPHIGLHEIADELRTVLHLQPQ